MGPQTSVFGANLNHSGRVVLPIKQRARTLGNEKLFGFSTKQGSTLGGNSDRPAFTLSKPADFILNKPNFAAPLVSSNRGVVGIMGSPTGEEPVDYLGEKFPSNISSNQSALNTQAAPAAIDTTAASSGATERVPLKRGASMARRTYDRTKSSSALPSLSNKRRLERSSTAMGLPDMRESKTLQQSLLNTTGAISETSEERDKERERDRDNKDVTSRRTEVEAWQDSAALQNMTDIFRNMARACGSFSIHKYADALAQFGKLPFTYLNSGWVQCQIAKCKFEISSFEDAAKHFEMARALEPHMHRDMDLYSSCLWHLKKETALSTLAKDLKDSDNQSHVAWVALGNAYNLRQEHEQALHCFQRAIQLNDRYAYAHTLAGQEYYALDEHDKAQAEYQLAMTINPRYFFPWYGMGQIYGKMGKNDLSLVYYQEAQKLNPSNGVLVYQLGMIQEKLDRLDDARLSYKRAINIHPSNVVARFRLAKLLADMGQMLEAIEELERVKNLAPSEPKVYMLLGKILDKMGNQEESLKYLTWALDLDSKSSHEIQGLIDKVNNGSEEQDNNYDYIMND
ncbi:hypothetical protein BG004_001678 [Podila humilis]|nr:hypothetical protein BG004_001678 [Podila humilis]